ncbi:hypothetical protein V6N12_066731 [Hibiscus sabdariffa]|uniref:Uncharacterized protein n=1 Tax=Hibiscus sabdariffa TaxID=183260 RepID=A0ABR2BDK8_9ROSI
MKYSLHHSTSGDDLYEGQLDPKILELQDDVIINATIKAHSLLIFHAPLLVSPIINIIEFTTCGRWFLKESSASLMMLLWNACHENEKAHGIIGMLTPSLVILAITDGVCNDQCISSRVMGAIVSASTNTLVLAGRKNQRNPVITRPSYEGACL